MSVWVVLTEGINALASVRVFHERDTAVAYARSAVGTTVHNHETHGTGGFLTITTDNRRIRVIPQTVS